VNIQFAMLCFKNMKITHVDTMSAVNNIITFVSSSLDKNPKWDKNNLAVLKSVQG